MRTLQSFLFVCIIIMAQQLNAQDTIFTWQAETLIGKVTGIDGKIIKVILEEEPEKEYRIHAAEIEKIVYADGKVVYFFEEYPDLVKKMKKSSPRTKMIEVGFLSPTSNHFYGGYEHVISKKYLGEYHLGIITPMLMPNSLTNKLNGFYFRGSIKYLFSEPMRISGLSVRPKMQGAYIGLAFTNTFISYNYNLTYTVFQGGNYYQEVRKVRVSSYLPTLHLVFGYNNLIAPSIMLGYCAGLGGGPEIIMNQDAQIRDKAGFEAPSFGGQSWVSKPLSIYAMITVGILLRKR